MSADVRGFYSQLGVELPDRGGSNVTVRCFNPEHGDRRPSCSVNLAHGAWQCFACGKSGGAYGAALAVGKTKREAMELLERHGFEVDDPAPRSPGAAEAPTMPQDTAEAPGELVSLEGVAIRRPRWAWRQRIPLGMVTTISGKRGVGKSTLVANLVAAVTRGTLDGDLLGKPAGVLLANFEDPVRETTAPRLLAADADPERVRVLSMTRPLSLPDDAEWLGERCAKAAVRLVVLDPVTAALAADVDAHRDADVRRAFVPLARLAEEHEIAVVSVMHPRKARAEDPLDELSGSAAFTNFPRSVLLAAWDPTAPDGDRRRVLVHAKSNVAPEAPTLEWRVEPATVEGPEGAFETSRCIVGDESSITAADLAPRPVGRDESPERDKAETFLREALADGGWHLRLKLVNAAAGEGVAERTLERAAKALPIEKRDSPGAFPRQVEWRMGPALDISSDDGLSSSANPCAANDLGGTGPATVAEQAAAQIPLGRAENNSAASTANPNNDCGGTTGDSAVPPRSAPPRAPAREGSLPFSTAGDGEPEAVDGGTDGSDDREADADELDAFKALLEERRRAV